MFLSIDLARQWLVRVSHNVLSQGGRMDFTPPASRNGGFFEKVHPLLPKILDPPLKAHVALGNIKWFNEAIPIVFLVQRAPLFFILGQN